MLTNIVSDGLVQPPTRPGCNNKSCLKAIRIEDNLEVPATKLGQFVGKLSGNIQPATSETLWGSWLCFFFQSSQVNHSEI